jgi:hypothetical protein
MQITTAWNSVDWRSGELLYTYRRKREFTDEETEVQT